ncbi:MAG: flagellar hook-length control protein FliK [Wujia sp.]
MNIGDSLQLNIFPNTSDKIQGTNQSEVTNVKNPQMDANRLITQTTVGDVFEGTVLDVHGDKVTIQLDNLSMLQARLGEAMSLNIGDSLQFEVRENTGSTVMIRPFAQGMEQGKDQAIFKLLESHNLSPSQKNYQIAESLMKQNMPVDKASMQKVMQQSYKFPDVSIDTLVTMNKMKIPVNEANIAQFEKYQSNQHQMMQGIENFTQALHQVMDRELMQVPTAKEGLQFESALMQSLSDAKDLPQLSSEFMEQLIREETGQIADNPTGKIEDALQVPGRQMAAKQLLQTLSSVGVSQSMLEAVAKESQTPLQFVNHLNMLLQTMEQNGKLSDKEWKEFASSPTYKELMKSVIKEKFTLNPEEMKDPSEVKELYKSLYEKADKMMNLGSGAAGQQLSESAKNMQERIDFMQNLSEMYAYAQLPVRMDGTEHNTDLYVYMNKKRMKSEKEEVSALLHLDMDYLGPTDVHVSLHGTQVHTRFYVEDEISAKILDEHMNALEQAIAENGFTLTNEVVMREPTLLGGQKNAVVKEMFTEDIEQSVKRYSFDVRT